MNIREAIFKAADHIDTNPKDWHFLQLTVPKHCGSPGCAIGWIAHFAGRCSTDTVHKTGFCSALLGVGHDEFYQRMTAINATQPEWDQDRVWSSFSQGGEPHLAARCLRLYADKYHPAAKLGIPDSVRAIFETEQSAAVC